MSYFEPQSPVRSVHTPAVVVVIGRAPATPKPGATPRTWMALTWSLSRAGAAAAGLVPEAGDAEPSLELRVPWAPGGQVRDASDVRARLIDGAIEHELTLEAVRPGSWAFDAAAGLHHLDLPGLVQVTARVDAGGIAVLYARTEVLGRLGLTGGRYDFGSAAVVSDPA